MTLVTFPKIFFDFISAPLKPGEGSIFLFLVFRRKDLSVKQDPKPQVCSNFQCPFCTSVRWTPQASQVSLTFGQPLGQADLQSDIPPGRGIWWPRVVLHQVSLTFGLSVGQADIQSVVPPGRGIWWPRVVLHQVSLTFG